MTDIKPYREERPWGRFIEYTRNSPSTVKILEVKAGEALSLQKHDKRDEFWYVISGDGKVTVGNTEHDALPGSIFNIPRGTNHRISGGTIGLSVLEVSTGIFEDEDIVRLEDKYGRK